MKSRGQSVKGAGDNSGIYICNDCGADAGKLDADDHGPGVWRGEQIVYHCDGSRWVFRSRYRGESHHYNSIYGSCWKCGRSLGCPLCAGRLAEEILCENFHEHDGLGAVWATKQAFFEHGPLIRQPHGPRQTLDVYPPAWAQEYEPMEVTDAAVTHLNRLLDSIGKEKPRGFGETE